MKCLLKEGGWEEMSLGGGSLYEKRSSPSRDYETNDAAWKASHMSQRDFTATVSPFEDL